MPNKTKTKKKPYYFWPVTTKTDLKHDACWCFCRTVFGWCCADGGIFIEFVLDIRGVPFPLYLPITEVFNVSPLLRLDIDVCRLFNV